MNELVQSPQTSSGDFVPQFTNVGVSPITINGVRIEPGATEVVDDPDPEVIARFVKQGSLEAPKKSKKQEK